MKLLNQAFCDIYSTCPSATGPRKGKTKISNVSLKSLDYKNHDPIKLRFAFYFMAFYFINLLSNKSIKGNKELFSLPLKMQPVFAPVTHMID